MSETPIAESDAGRRLDQIARTAHRVRPFDVGKWASAESLPLGPADAMVIAPADLQWLLRIARDSVTPPGATPGGEGK